MDESVWKIVWRFLTDRLFLMFVIIAVMFAILTTKLFDLQIVNGESYQRKLQITTLKKLDIYAPRGTFYDKFGRPLAVNQSAFIVKLDPGVQIDNINEVMYNLVKLFEKNGQEYVDDFPISKERPYVFEAFIDNSDRERRWKIDMAVPEDLNAEQTMQYLCERFKMPESYTESEKRKVLSLRSMIYMQRFRQYSPITVAFDVKNEVVVSLEEENDKYPSIYIDTESLREYPTGELFSHLIGYTGKITDTELAANNELGYTMFDNIGKTGLEKALEKELKGTNGEVMVEVNSVGKPVKKYEPTDPIAGNKVFLTVDQDLQAFTYNRLEEMLVEVIKNKMRGLSSREAPITQKQLFISMVKANTIPVKNIMESKEGDYSYKIREIIYAALPEANLGSAEEKDKVKEVVTEAIENGKISPRELLLVMYEQGMITFSEEGLERLKNGRISTLQVIFDKLDAREITPQMTNLDPSTGSVVVVDVNTGDVLSAVGYPTYDTNQFVNNFSNEYYYKLYEDPTTPMLNRPFAEPRAPGSTFKMISAIAALQSGYITPQTRIYDKVVFETAGKPYIRCWSASSHGNINVSQAIGVSCNHFFADATYRMGNAKEGTTLEGIEDLNNYMIAFGLNDSTGVEIGEYVDTIKPYSTLAISSPEYKQYIETSRDPDAPYKWTDGNTTQTSIGQSYNNYTAATMAKYTATLATGGKRYKMHLMDRIESQQGELKEEFQPVVETVVTIDPKNLQAVYDGMLLVTEGSQGTGAKAFEDFPIRVAGKTGTAQQSEKRNDHASFSGFAPYEDPQIAVYVMIPFGDTKTTTAPAAQVARDVIGEYLGLNVKPERATPDNSLAL